MTLFQDEANKLIETEAPLDPKSLEYKVVKLTAEGMEPSAIAKRLGESDSEIEDAINNVVDEFGDFLA
jgi:transposase